MVPSFIYFEQPVGGLSTSQRFPFMGSLEGDPRCKGLGSTPTTQYQWRMKVYRSPAKNVMILVVTVAHAEG